MIRRIITRGIILYSPRDVRVEERPNPTIIEPTDALIGISTTCVCGSDHKGESVLTLQL